MVPGSWEKTTLPALISLSSLLSGSRCFLGHRDGETSTLETRTPQRSISISDQSAAEVTGRPPGTGKLLAKLP
jgi:hypothetical protein